MMKTSEGFSSINIFKEMISNPMLGHFFRIVIYVIIESSGNICKKRLFKTFWIDDSATINSCIKIKTS